MSASISLGTLMVVLATLGIVGNTMVIYIFTTKKKMRTLFHYILICLLLSDNLYLVCTLLGAINFDFGVKSLVWTMPYFVFPFKDISRTACLLTTIILSYERYSICCDPKKFKRSNSISSEKKNKYKLIMVMISVWTFSILK